jgi:hypothetical protein
MTGKDLKIDLGPGDAAVARLTPTVSVRRVEGKAHRPEDEGRSRARSRMRSENRDDEALQEADEPAHELDDYA